MKKYPSREEHFHFAKTLHLLTVGKKESLERMIVRQMLHCRKHWPNRESIYKDVLFQRVIDLDADFLKIVIEEIEHAQGGPGEDNPQAAAVVRGHMHLWDTTGEFPTANELFDYVKANEPACKMWTRFDKFNRPDSDSSYIRTMRDICDRYKLSRKPERPGRKPQLGK